MAPRRGLALNQVSNPADRSAAGSAPCCTTSPGARHTAHTLVRTEIERYRAGSRARAPFRYRRLHRHHGTGRSNISPGRPALAGVAFVRWVSWHGRSLLSLEPGRAAIATPFVGFSRPDRLANVVVQSFGGTMSLAQPRAPLTRTTSSRPSGQRLIVVVVTGLPPPMGCPSAGDDGV